ncbi:ATP-binding cassette sub- F member 3 [Blyttiomyces sp. JEL0837]|nr:ATP-binding cassette sub- F member 3 [Blyttiomyces sp. JEL0837]
MEEVKDLLTANARDVDPDTFQYMLSYFDDPSNDLTSEGLREFLGPMLTDCTEEEIEELCDSIPALLGITAESVTSGSESHARRLNTSVQMTDAAALSKTIEFTAVGRVGDIRHTMSKAGPSGSTVDQKKLRKAELKLASKRAERGAKQEYEIPVWNPNVKPSMIVNQVKAPSAASESRSKDIRIENFDISFAGKKILTNADLSMTYGRRYGLVGKNGIGKSTLLRAIASGDLRVPSHIRILHVEQEIAGDDTPAIMSVLQADKEREALLQEEKTLSAQIQKSSISQEEANTVSERLKVVYQKLEEIESDKAESKASAILNGLGFSKDQQVAATRTFSGGWRMRLALARALFCRPDLLLADEVTNYLDFPAVVWLENYFCTWQATLLVVSHDRSFLDAVTTDILHLHNGQLDYYKGNFSSYVTARAERRKNQLREYEAQLQYRQHLQAFVDRWRYNANRAAQAQSKLKILEKLPELVAPAKDDMEGLGEGEAKDLYFRFPEPEKISPPILQMSEVSFKYPSTTREILSNISFDLQMDSKIAVVGPNGAGKSTMIYLLTGQNQPTGGICHRHGRLRLGLFSQHHVDQLELADSAVQFLAKKFPGRTEEEYRRVLGRFGLTGTTALQPIGTLSGGQKSRVVFGAMSLQNPHVLILDEPTNHLDMDSIDALAQALKEFKGGVAIVSHDQRFLDTVCNEVWICQGGKLTSFEGRVGDGDGVVQQYKKSLLKDQLF